MTRLEEFMQLCAVQSKSNEEELMQTYVLKHLRDYKRLCKNSGQKFKYSRDEHGNIFAVKGRVKDGEYFPFLTCHLDTVHDILETDLHVKTAIGKSGTKVFAMGRAEERYGRWDKKTRKTQPIYKFRRVGLGSDDKNGIFACLNLLHILPVVKVGFFVGEEIGCKGSNASSEERYQNVGYFIAIDRMNSGDIIGLHNYCSDEFKKKVLTVGKRYGYQSANGSYTDSLTLGRKYELSAINVSCGYYSPHTDTEYTIFEELTNAIDFVHDLVKTIGLQKFEYKKAVVQTYTGNQYGRTGRYFRNYEDDVDHGYNRTIRRVLPMTQYYGLYWGVEFKGIHPEFNCPHCSKPLDKFENDYAGFLSCRNCKSVFLRKGYYSNYGYDSYFV